MPRRTHRQLHRASAPISMYGMGLGAGHWGGAFSRSARRALRRHNVGGTAGLHRPAAAASVADNICDAYRHISPHLPDLLARDPNAEVLVFAAHSPRSLFTPSCPLYTGMIALAMGARSVHFADSRPWVRAHAERLGMHALHRARAAAHHSPLVADVSVDGLPHALAATAPDGVCSSSGGLHRSVQIPLLRMYVRNATLHVGRTHVRALMPEVPELMARGGLHPEAITTTVAPLDVAPSVLREHFLGGESVKTVYYVLRSIRRPLAHLPSEVDGTLIPPTMPGRSLSLR